MPSFNRTRLDRDSERNGAWKPYRKVPGVEVLICRYGHPAHKALLTKLTQARLAEVQAATAARREAEKEGRHDDPALRDDRGVLREINAECLARELVKDWRGVTESDEDDAPEVPYSWETAYAFAMDPELPFYDDMLELSMTEATFRKAAEEGSRGN